jgi:hypothetical protein
VVLKWGKEYIEAAYQEMFDNKSHLALPRMYIRGTSRPSGLPKQVSHAVAVLRHSPLGFLYTLKTDLALCGPKARGHCRRSCTKYRVDYKTRHCSYGFALNKWIAVNKKQP